MCNCCVILIIIYIVLQAYLTPNPIILISLEVKEMNSSTIS